MTAAPRFAFTILVVLCAAGPAPAEVAESLLLSEKARVILRTHCGKCHTGPQARGGWQVLDFAKLEPLITKGRPENSELLQLIECGSEPRGTTPKVPPDEIKVVRDWIAGQALPFAPESSDDYAFRQILLDIRAAAAAAPNQRDPSRERYFTFNHLLGEPGASPELYAEALTRALNLLSWEKEFVRPTAIDPTGTIFRVDIGKLGWGTTPYAGSSLNLFDLILLENPHAVVPRKSPVYDELDREYLGKLQKGKPVRPVVFLRGDWFVSAAGQNPLYEDLLRLPVTLTELERKLQTENALATRAGLLKFGEVQAPRIIERRSTSSTVMWRTYDLRSVNGKEKLLETAEKPVAVGEAIFSLPNGLPGFYIAGPDGHRFPDVAGDLRKGVAIRNGLACASCHGNGLVTDFTDVVRPNLDGSMLLDDAKIRLRHLYPEALPKDAATDNGRFTAALAQLFDKVPERDAIALVKKRYDNWSAKQKSGPDETPPPAIDGLTHPNIERAQPLKVDVAMINVKTKAKADRFGLREDMYLYVRNNDTPDVWIEPIAIGRGGEMFELLGKDTFGKRLPPIRLRPGETYRYPPDDKTMSSGPDECKNWFILYISDQEFSGGTLMTPSPRNAVDYVADRFVHPYPKSPAEVEKYARMEKRTLTIETRAK
jgi:hypothetical protein